MSFVVGESHSERLGKWLDGLKKGKFLVQGVGSRYRPTCVSNGCFSNRSGGCDCAYSKGWGQSAETRKHAAQYVKSDNNQMPTMTKYYLQYRTLIKLSDIGLVPAGDKEYPDDSGKSTIYVKTEAFNPLCELLVERTNTRFLLAKYKSLLLKTGDEVITDNESIQLYRKTLLHSQLRSSLVMVYRSELCREFSRQILYLSVISIALTGRPALFIDFDLELASAHHLNKTELGRELSDTVCFVFPRCLSKELPLTGGLIVAILSANDSANRVATELNQMNAMSFQLVSFYHNPSALTSFACASEPCASAFVALADGHCREPVVLATIISCLMHFVFRQGCSVRSLQRALRLLTSRMSTDVPFYFKQCHELSIEELIANGFLVRLRMDEVELAETENSVLSSLPLFGHLVDLSAFVLSAKVCPLYPTQPTISNKDWWVDVVTTLSLFLPRSSLHFCDASVNERWLNVLSWANAQLLILNESQMGNREAAIIELMTGNDESSGGGEEESIEFTLDLDLNNNQLMVTLLENFGLELMAMVNRFCGYLTSFLSSKTRLLDRFRSLGCANKWNSVLYSLFLHSLTTWGVLRDIENDVCLLGDGSGILAKALDVSSRFNDKQCRYLRSLTLLKANQLVT